MRNLKKVLSLVLALMMVLSVMVTANAAFEDVADDSNYKEAIEVMAAAGVLNGKGSGFDPAGTLTRREAAKIITYVLLGGDVDPITADTLAHPFTDVAKGQWYTNPINYCYAQGIIDGKGNNTFDPNGTLDGYAFAKMLLVASGINDDYLGANYKKNVSKHFYAEGLDTNLPASFLLGNPLSREHAAQMAFNVICKQLTANAAGGRWYVVVDNQKVYISADDVVLYKLAGIEPKFEAAQPSTTYFGSALKLDDVYDVNDAGLNYHYWTVNGKEVGLEYIDDVKVASFAAGTTYKALLADLGYTDKSTQGAAWYANGVEKASYSSVELVALLKSTTKIPAPVDVYVDGLGNYKLMATIEYIATAKCIDDKADKDTGLYTYTFTVNTVGGTYEVDVEAEKDAYSKDAAYLVVPQGDNTAAEKFLSIVETAPVKVTVTGKGASYVRAGSDKYTVAVGLDASKVLKDVVVADDFNLYLASDGSLIWVEEYVEPNETPDTTENLVFLTAVWKELVKGEEGTTDKWGNTEGATSDKYNYYAQGVDVDGEEIDIVISAKDFADETILNKLWNVVYDKTDKVNDLETPTTAFQTSALADKKISFKVQETVEGVLKTTTYYYDTAEYLHIIGNKNDLKVGAGKLADALKSTNVWVIFTGDKANKTVTNVIYWTGSAITTDPTDPFIGAPVDMFLAKDSVSTDETYVTYIPQGEEEAVNENVWYHDVLINGEKPEDPILYNKDTIKAGFYTYYEGAYGYYVLKELTGTYATVENVYGNYVSFGETIDWDISGIEITDLTEEPDNTVDAGDYIAFYTITNADGSTTVARIYILTAPEA